MINEPFEPVSEPRACGWPYHGIVAERRVGGVRQYTWIVDGVERAFPPEMADVPFDSHVAHKVRHPSAPKLDLTNEEVDSEHAAGREWFDFATIAGSQSLFYGHNLGAGAWIAVLDDNKAWTVQIYAEQVPATLRYRWVMKYSRTGIGPVSGLSGYSPTQTFWVELAPEAVGALLFSEASAQSEVSGSNDYGKVMDVSRNGTLAIIDNAIVRVITSADLAPYALTLATATGELPFVFNAVVHGTKATITNSSYGRFRKQSGMVLQRYDLSATTLSTMPTSEASAPLSAGVVLPSGSTRVNSIDPGFPTMWIDYQLYDVPPRVEVETWETSIKAHLSEDIDGEIVEFKVVSELTSTQVYSGQACAWSAFDSSGAISPDFVRCPPPTLAAVSTNYTLRQVITYGDAEYRGERTWSSVEAASGVTVSDCTPRPAAGKTTGNFTIFGAQIVPQAYAGDSYAFYRGRPAAPGAFSAGAWDALVAPPYPMQPDDSNASFLASWNRNNFSMRDPVVDETHMRSVTAMSFQPIMARYSMVENYFANSMPAAVNIPKGLYYKGKFITPWLPAYNDVWTMNPKTYEISVFSRAPTYTSDGYLNAVYI